ncbi:hypothetical protein Y1Q_0021484 [Alligator mississippiensis]|uniref:Uncharacterized protein n=1 Tax=Alligator mississippiensis TaxID=8496 RepID=A0A151PA95_ALLMI|nr:hypothetical protein Y1Q_0021484 [Alligator mississippiensis]
MHWATFMDISTLLAHHIRCQNISIWLPLTPEKQVAIAIMKLATPSIFCYIANQLAMGKSTVRDVIQEVCLAI